MAPALISYGSLTPEEDTYCKHDYFEQRSPPDIYSSPAVPKVSSLDMKDYQPGDGEALVSNIVRSLRESGGCIIQNMIPPNSLSQCEDEIRPYLNTTKQANAEREDFVPSNTRMVTGLLSKSHTYALTVAGNDIWQRVNEYFLTSTLKNSWHGNQSHTSVSKPQLSTTVTFSVQPGTTAQGLHRDDDIYHTWHPASKEHHQGRDTMVCFFIAGSKCTRENGATRIVPGSHLWNYSQPPPEPSSNAFFAAEMEPGDAFMMLGGTYHGAGANTTTDQERLIYAAFATRGYLRQEENQYLANDLDKIKKLPVSLQQFAGFSVSKPYMGWVDMEDPVTRVLEGKATSPAGDFW